jgi:hypothetical protein
MSDPLFVLIYIVMAVIAAFAAALTWMYYVTYPKVPRGPALTPEVAAEAYEKREGFWATYCQCMISLIVILVIAVLLLLKIINPDAGLPILAAIGGAAIGQVSGLRRGRSETPPRGTSVAPASAPLD